MLLAGLSSAALKTFIATGKFAARCPATLTTTPTLSSEIARVQAQGYATTEGELEAGLRAIAVPVRNGKGQVVAALNLATQSSRRTPAWLNETALPELQAAAIDLIRVAGD